MRACPVCRFGGVNPLTGKVKAKGLGERHFQVQKTSGKVRYYTQDPSTAAMLTPPLPFPLYPPPGSNVVSWVKTAANTRCVCARVCVCVLDELLACLPARQNIGAVPDDALTPMHLSPAMHRATRRASCRSASSR